MRVLIVEDEKDLQNILVKRLNAEYYSVDGCGNGEDALDYISMATYDSGQTHEKYNPILRVYAV